MGGVIVWASLCSTRQAAQTCTGAVYLFTGSGSSWTQQTELDDPGQGYYDIFGWPLAISGGSILVSAIGENSSQGAVFVYTQRNHQWAEKADIADPAATANDLFGYSLQASGKELIVGAPETNGSTGVAYLFAGVSGGWVEKAGLTAANGEGCSTTCTQLVGLIYGDYFGNSVAIKGRTVAIGAPYASYPTPKPDSVGSGAVYVFTGSGGSWTQNTEIADPPEHTANETSPADCSFFNEPNCVAVDFFGYNVALLGTTVVATAPYDSQGYPNYATGAAFVIPKKGAMWPSAVLLTELVASDGAPGDYFGYSGLTTIGHNTVAVGAPYAPNGGLYFFKD